MDILSLLLNSTVHNSSDLHRSVCVLHHPKKCKATSYSYESKKAIFPTPCHTPRYRAHTAHTVLTVSSSKHYKERLTATNPIKPRFLNAIVLTPRFYQNLLIPRRERDCKGSQISYPFYIKLATQLQGGTCDLETGKSTSNCSFIISSLGKSFGRNLIFVLLCMVSIRLWCKQHVGNVVRLSLLRTLRRVVNSKKDFDLLAMHRTYTRKMTTQPNN